MNYGPKYSIQLEKYLLFYINSKDDQKNDYNQNTVPKLENWLYFIIKT